MLNQLDFIDFMLLHFNHFVEIAFENNIFIFNVKIKFNTLIKGGHSIQPLFIRFYVEMIFYEEDYVLLFYVIKNLLTAYHIDKLSTGKIIELTLLAIRTFNTFGCLTLTFRSVVD